MRKRRRRRRRRVSYLRDLRPAGRRQRVRLQVVLCLVAEPVGLVLGGGSAELRMRQLRCEVVLAEGGDGDEVGAVALAELAGLLPGVADVEELVTGEAVQLPLA